MKKSSVYKWLRRIGIASIVPFGSIYVIIEIIVQYIQKTRKEVNVDAVERTQKLAEDQNRRSEETK